MTRNSSNLIYIIPVLYLFVFMSLEGCQGKHRNVYNENDYILTKVDSFEGKLDAGNYIYKYDTSRTMKINYFFDGKILAKSFYHSGKIDGVLEAYEHSGRLLAKDSFHEGVKILSQKFYKVDTSIRIFKDGKLYAPDSNGTYHESEN